MNIKVISQENKVTVKSNNAIIKSSTIPTKVIVSSSVGLRGYSAFEIAQRNGFTGTEQEWINRSSSNTPVDLVELHNSYANGINLLDVYANELENENTTPIYEDLNNILLTEHNNTLNA